MATAMPARPPSPSPSQVPLPASPTYSYASTANPLSSYNLPLPPPPRPVHAVLTKSDLEQSQQAYSDLLATAKSYRIALSTLSTAASAFGSALESCARLKESRADALGPPGGASLTNSFTAKNTCTADLLLSASGVHHLVANHQQILSETVYRSFEVPLLHELDRWRRAIEDEDETYKREAATRSREIRRLEKEGLKLHRQSRRRDVAKFREHLVALTGKLDGLTALHADHARSLLRDSQETSARILDASCSLVRAEVDIFEGLARKGWTGGGLDDLLEKGQDLFASEDDVPAAVVVPGAGGVGGAGDGGAKLFSILPPKSILANDSTSDSVLTAPSHGRADSLLVDSDDVQYQSLTGAVDQKDRGRDADSQSLFSESNVSQNRGVRPFSPQPIRRRGMDVVMDPESLLVGEEGLRTDDDNDDDDDSYDAATVRGVRDTSAQRTGLGGLRIGADENDIEEPESPWKDEGLRRKQESTSSSDSGKEPPLPPSAKDEVDNR
ncbi:uncharacterized protein GGS22DRAFT_166134 [Annulohypoxylon maeteangense]|uniref:uncharacterized protein n=1 Tax=Annulohypoxylon maeteangense TaxID=1927788 RepID=UPI002008462A|nr:uncharacterized protein GGS22DRAFT_166134 [Annulohypoxylon maeteangense]KAI0883805.1 hypothetical protein GGS22DRAFT_166134 [Annulohypoxylon maeteangense]